MTGTKQLWFLIAMGLLLIGAVVLWSLTPARNDRDLARDLEGRALSSASDSPALPGEPEDGPDLSPPQHGNEDLQGSG